MTTDQLPVVAEDEDPLLERLGDQIERFLHMESAGGVLLFVAACLAMLLKNSPLSEFYIAFLNIEAVVRVGAVGVEKPLFLWINDFLMAIFFFLIGLEIKREVLHGHLADRSQIVLPTAGAIGGVAVPAAIYLWFNAGDPQAVVGWAIPTATDIAFSLGVLALLGTRVPPALKIFLMTLAILDDLIAIIVIALFYTAGLSLTSLLAGAVFLAGLVILNRLRVLSVAPYLLLGIALWLCVLKSGVHATLAGVVTALFIPSLQARDGEEAPLDYLIDELHPWVAFAILPLFAFANAGVALDGLELGMLLDPVPLGIALGLVVGKPVGVVVFSALVVVLGIAARPAGVTWLHFLGVGFLCGVGFTMSLFIAGLAFAEGGGYARVDRLGLLVGSLVCAVVGYLILRYAPRPQPQTQEGISS